MLNRPVLNAHFSPSGSRILVTGALPYFYVYSVKDKQVKKEEDTVTVNNMEKQAGGELLVRDNSKL